MFHLAVVFMVYLMNDGAIKLMINTGNGNIFPYFKTGIEKRIKSSTFY